MEAAPNSASIDDELARLELRVAQRADELARLAAKRSTANRDREMWLRAERELFAPVDEAQPSLRHER
jgi:hypothetical protein